MKTGDLLGYYCCRMGISCDKFCFQDVLGVVCGSMYAMNHMIKSWIVYTIGPLGDDHTTIENGNSNGQ